MTNFKQIIIFDTTLRDGEQSPGMSMNLEEKIMIAEALDSMGVDVIEAGFAMASNGDFEAVQAIAGHIKNSVVCSLARAKPADIERAAEALKPAKNGRIHTFMSTSEIHLKYQYKMDQARCLEMIKESVTLARNFTDNVEWSAMDATRTEVDFLIKAVETAIKAGATTINLPDTVGYATPDDYGLLFKTIIERASGADKAIFSTHCHNDLGLAAANALAGIRAGARQIECTINGIGERAGNTALEEVVMAIRTRPVAYPFVTNIDTTHIIRTSRLIQSVTGALVQVNKAIVGANAFAHESGIHQDGVLKHAGTYEIMTPESVGITKSNLVMGKHSGRHAFKDKIAQLGFVLGDNALEDAFTKFKDLADKKKEIYDEELVALLDSESRKEDTIRLESLHITCGTVGPQTAMLCLRVDGEIRRVTVEGNGPVDAAFNAIRALVPHNANLQLYQVSAITQGTDAQAEVTVRLETEGGKIVNGNSSNIDTVVASALAYISALCKLQAMQEREGLLPSL